MVSTYETLPKDWKSGVRLSEDVKRALGMEVPTSFTTLDPIWISTPSALDDHRSGVTAEREGWDLRIAHCGAYQPYEHMLPFRVTRDARSLWHQSCGDVIPMYVFRAMMSWAAGLEPLPLYLIVLIRALEHLIDSGDALRQVWDVRMLHPPHATADVRDLVSALEHFVAAYHRRVTGVAPMEEVGFQRQPIEAPRRTSFFSGPDRHVTKGRGRAQSMDGKGKGKGKGKDKTSSLGPGRRATGATPAHETGLDAPEVSLPHPGPAPFIAVPVADPLHLATLAEWEDAVSNPPVTIEGGQAGGHRLSDSTGLPGGDRDMPDCHRRHPGSSGNPPVGQRHVACAAGSLSQDAPGLHLRGGQPRHWRDG